MTPIIILLSVLILFAVVVWMGISKAADDGFFITICGLLVVFSAFQFVNFQWEAFFHLLRKELSLADTYAISTSYWVGFTVIMAPGMLLIRFLSDPKVPFPKAVEQYGSMMAGAFIGIILFATIMQSFAKFSFFDSTLSHPLGYFRFLFQALGAQHFGI